MDTAPERVPENQEPRSMSVRRTITLPRELDEWLTRWAARRNVPPAVLIRMLISASRERERSR